MQLCAVILLLIVEGGRTCAALPGKSTGLLVDRDADGVWQGATSITKGLLPTAAG